MGTVDRTERCTIESGRARHGRVDIGAGGGGPEPGVPKIRLRADMVDMLACPFDDLLCELVIDRRLARLRNDEQGFVIFAEEVVAAAPR